jgi:glycosyltransferase involved in cell wall biosynthesis
MLKITAMSKKSAAFTFSLYQKAVFSFHDLRKIKYSYMTSPERCALVHDWLTGMRGGEKCLEVMCELFPDAPIYTLLSLPENLSETITKHPIHTSFIQRLPSAEARYRNYLPLFPRAIESFSLGQADLVVSSSHAVAKGIIVPDKALDISYIYTPMRYVWDMFEQYFSIDKVGYTKRAVIQLFARRLRNWDVKTSSRVHHFIAISEYIRDRIKRHYNRDSDVIYPPVDTKRFQPTHSPDGSYLVVSALVPYKRVDLAVEVFNVNGLPLRIIGDGPELNALKARAKQNISFHGWVDDPSLEIEYANAKALIFPGEEDFGIVPVEAMASGTPVLAYGKGGALETVVHGKTGIHFPEQTISSLNKAIDSFEHMDIDIQAIREHAEIFDRKVYKDRLESYIEDKWKQWQHS